MKLTQITNPVALRLDAAEGAASNAVARVVALEAMSGLSPESPVDGQQANLISQPGTLTRQALNDDFARKTVIDANLHGVVADGVTDDKPAWQAIVNAAQPGDVITWTGRSAVYTDIIWKSGISLIGQGWGKSVLVPTNVPGELYRHAAIRYTESDGASRTNTLKDCVWADFEVDGGELEEDGTYWISAKGLFTLYHERCQWRNLYIHDTQATGLGCDFMRDCTITGVVAERCGYMNPGNVGGGAGIGIGTGAWEYEPLTISDCHTRDNGNWGIFVEVQEYLHPKPYGTGSRIIGCTSEGDRVGFGDRGTIGTTIANCVAINPKVAGISISFEAREGITEGNHVYESGGSGIIMQQGLSNYMVRGNHVLGSNKHGIEVDILGSDMSGITVESNHVTTSGNAGIAVTTLLSGSGRGIQVRDNRSWNNGQKRSNPRGGIYIEANLTDCMITGNRSFDDQVEPSQTVGIRAGLSSARTMTDLTIARNNVSGSNTPVSFGSNTTFVNRVVADNIGYATSTSGSASFADGASTVTVPHGVKGAPTQVQVTPHGAGPVWVKTRGVSNVIYERSDSTGELAFDWQATVKM